MYSIKSFGEIDMRSIILRVAVDETLSFEAKPLREYGQKALPPAYYDSIMSRAAIYANWIKAGIWHIINNPDGTYSLIQSKGDPIAVDAFNTGEAVRELSLRGYSRLPEEPIPLYVKPEGTYTIIPTTTTKPAALSPPAPDSFTPVITPKVTYTEISTLPPAEIMKVVSVIPQEIQKEVLAMPTVQAALKREPEIILPRITEDIISSTLEPIEEEIVYKDITPKKSNYTFGLVLLIGLFLTLFPQGEA